MILLRFFLLLISLVVTGGFAPLSFPGRGVSVHDQTSRLFDSSSSSSSSTAFNDSAAADLNRMSPVNNINQESSTETGITLFQLENASAEPPKAWLFGGGVQLFREKLQRVGLALRKPGMRFRVRLGLITTIAVSVAGFFVPKKQILLVIQKWIAHRGFQGIAALGRSVAYGWALLVAYPRMLDKRASERRKQEKLSKLDQRRKYLRSLAGEVVRLRQELSSIDGEIRAFRREIISLRAYANKENGIDPDVQEAIGTEMAHLAQLRADTQAALLAARHTWSEVRSKSPSEAWEDEILGMD